MIGRNPGQVTTQGEVLADLFRSDGWNVREASGAVNRWVRIIDIVLCLLRWRRSIDLVVLSVFSGPAFAVADCVSVITQALHLPLVMVLHGGNLPEFESRHPAWVHRVLKRAQAVVAPSAFLADGVRAAAGRAKVIPNVLDLDDYEFHRRTAPEARLMWMRTFHPIYNPTLAVRALEVVRRSTPAATLTMAGQDKGLLAASREEALRRGLGTEVRFAGFLDPTQKRAELSRHDIYLHTNHVDNTPVSVLEAAAAGLPIVATAVGGIPTLLTHGSTALLVPDDDADAMAAAIGRILTEPGLGERLSKNGRILAEASAWPAVRVAWEQVFHGVPDGNDVTKTVTPHRP